VKILLLGTLIHKNKRKKDRGGRGGDTQEKAQRREKWDYPKRLPRVKEVGVRGSISKKKREGKKREKPFPSK